MTMTTSDTELERSAECEVHCLHPEAVARVEAAMPSEARIEQATNLMKVVSDPTRFRILHALATEELCVCDLAVVAGIQESTTSHQLRLLRANGLVAFKKVGRVAYYRLADQGVARLIQDVLAHAP